MDSDDSQSYSSSVSSSFESADETALADCAGTQPYLFEPSDSEASSGADSSESSEEGHSSAYKTQTGKLQIVSRISLFYCKLL